MADYQGTWTHRGGALVFGYRYERQTGLISNVNVDRTNNGGFFHEQYTIGRRLFLTGGARIENSTTFGSRFVPRGSATFQLFKSTFLRASGGRGFTEPTLLENFAQRVLLCGQPEAEAREDHDVRRRNRPGAFQPPCAAGSDLFPQRVRGPDRVRLDQLSIDLEQYRPQLGARAGDIGDRAVWKYVQVCGQLHAHADADHAARCPPAPIRESDRSCRAVRRIRDPRGSR